ncbi:Short chain dehydrogenase nor1 [Hyphodiscus hymeniophilus]|uniref:Short chain dehydrogenase nor1 n=1 Tax=Hyphodiscus hymeniophilus TaxID=353542 RepID=A0A9P6SLX3_9HELO|nr:Short chain dehydrogenase nor1 [Hyphodiscus hymeniophilus]
MSPQVIVITGANRGIGKGLLSAYIARPDTIVIAAVRDVSKSTKDLSSVTVGKSSKLIVVKIDSTVDSDPATAVKELETKHSISKVDILISNAGLMGHIAPTIQTPAQVVREHFEVNTIGPLNLIQAFFPLLEKSDAPRFLVLTSTVGSIGNMESLPVPFFAYGVSKAAANYLVRKLHFENPRLTSMAFNPGWVQTDMGNGAAKGVGMEQAPVTLEESMEKLVALFDGADREKSGTFTEVTGESIPW